MKIKIVNINMQKFKSKTSKENKNDSRAALDLLGGGKEETEAVAEPHRISKEGERNGRKNLKFY